MRSPGGPSGASRWSSHGHPGRTDGRVARIRRSAGFTLAEILISMVIIGISLAASMRTAAAVLKLRGTTSDTTTGVLLAQQLLEEILEKSYKEPLGTAVFGPETGETTRTQFDDVDDYHNWSETPPKARDGSSITAFTGWQRTVTVESVASTDSMYGAGITDGSSAVGIGLRSGSSSEWGVKRITITVKKSGTVVVTVKTIRTDSWPGY